MPFDISEARIIKKGSPFFHKEVRHYRMLPIRDHNPSGRTPYITYSIIFLNCIIFFSCWGSINDPVIINEFFSIWALIPYHLSQGEGFYTLLSSTFLHGGILHLAGNMLFLYIFGDNLEDQMGHFGFLAFYLLSGVGASIIYYMTAPLSPIPLVGASGAIAGVMGGYLLLYPKARVDVIFFIFIFFKIISLRAWLVLGAWFLLQLANGTVLPSGKSGVAYWAHIGGFVVGSILCLPTFIRLGSLRFWKDSSGHPPHPEAEYTLVKSAIPKVKSRLGKKSPWG